MAAVTFTQNIQRHVPCPTQVVRGSTVRDVLDQVFADNQRARGYVLDEHGAVRKHIVVFIVVFINGQPIVDRNGLSDAVEETDEVFVFQALSGG